MNDCAKYHHSKKKNLGGGKNYTIGFFTFFFEGLKKGPFREKKFKTFFLCFRT